MQVILADLGHNQLTISSDVYPLGVANLKAYADAYLEPGRPIQISIVREPKDLKAAIDAGPPEVLGLSSYSWNHNLSLCFARYLKERRPEALVLMGGPNFPLTAPEQESFLRSMPDVDVAVRGPTYEGERAFLNLLRRFVDVNGSREELLAEPVNGNMWIHPRTGECIRGGEVERIRDLDEIPSPYLAGMLDPYFATGYFPMLQISRGCPFSCTFCNSSVKSNSKIYSHSLKNLCADLLYMAERVRPEIPACFADDNFGMYELDEDVADYIAWLQDRFHWPKYIRTTTGKNQGERIIRVMRKVRGAMPMTSAVQSLNPVVLRNIKRSNISLDTYTEIQREVQAQGMQAYGELILCMPGETRLSFMQAVRDLLETGVKRISAHQLMLLHGAPLSNPESRQQFGLRTRFRVVARDVGNYTGKPVIETEEMVVETPDFSFDDYLDTRVFHLLLTIFYYEGNFEEAFQFAAQHGCTPYDLIVRLQNMHAQAPAGFRQVIDDFRRESQEELFPTREACVEWAEAHFDEMVDGRLGGNLLSKYSMIGRFYVLHEALAFLEAGIAAAQAESAGSPRAELLTTVIDYMRSVMLHVPFAQCLATHPRWSSGFDVEAWRDEGYTKDLEAYRYDESRCFDTQVEADRRKMLETRLSMFGEHPSGLGKFTRTMFARDLRRTLVSQRVLEGAGQV